LDTNCFILTKPNDLDIKEQYQDKLSNRFAVSKTGMIMVVVMMMMVVVVM
jgi:hypothetical protein